MSLKVWKITCCYNNIKIFLRSLPPFLLPFAKKNCNDTFDRLQSLLAQSSKHITHARVCKSTGIHTHTHIYTESHYCFLNLCFSITHTHTKFQTLVKTSPQNDQKPILTFLTGTEVGHPFSAFFFSFCAEKPRLFMGKAPATFGMCCSPSIFISSVSRITEHLYLIASYEGAQLLRQA